MSLRIGWVSPFNNRTGIGTFSKAVTDAMPDGFEGEAVDLTIILPSTSDVYRTHHRVVDIATAEAGSGFYDLFDYIIFNMGNNPEHHSRIFEVARNHPGIIISHDYVYQHFFAGQIHALSGKFDDYVALTAQYGSAEALREVRQSNLTGTQGLRYGPWEGDLCATEPLAAPLLQLGSALVVHSAFAEAYARGRFSGPVLRLGLPHDQRPRAEPRPQARRSTGGRLTLVSYGHLHATKRIDDIILAIAGSGRLRDEIVFVIAGFAGDAVYLERLRGLVRENGLERSVRFALNLSDGDLAELSGDADGFVNLRYPNTEGGSVSVIEQLDTGKPVIVIDSGCYAEIPDDAAFKVRRPKDVPGLRNAMLAFLDARGRIAEIGARGQAFARRFDCAGYARQILEFVHRERDLLRRRAAEKAVRTIEWSSRAFETHPDDHVWSEALGAARTSFDLIDRGWLAASPSIFRNLGPQASIDYIQATALCNGHNLAAQEALKEYLADKPDPYLAARALRLAREVAAQPSAEASAAFAEICPRGDMAFWTIVASLGTHVLEGAAHQAFFGTSPLERLCSGPTPTRDAMVLNACLATALSARDRGELIGPPHELDAFLIWLRRSGCTEAATGLAPLAKGRPIRIGAPHWNRHVRLVGFYDPESEHVWSKGGTQAILLMRLPREPCRVEVVGHVLDPSLSSVRISAEVGQSSSPPAVSRSADGRHAYELVVPNGGRTEDGILVVISVTPSFSPAELGRSSDTRSLGFCLTEVAITSGHPAGAARI